MSHKFPLLFLNIPHRKLLYGEMSGKCIYSSTALVTFASGSVHATPRFKAGKQTRRDKVILNYTFFSLSLSSFFGIIRERDVAALRRDDGPHW